MPSRETPPKSLETFTHSVSSPTPHLGTPSFVRHHKLLIRRTKSASLCYGLFSTAIASSTSLRAAFLCGFFVIDILERQHRYELLFGSFWETAPTRKISCVLISPKQTIPKRDVREVVSVNVILMMYRM